MSPLARGTTPFVIGVTGAIGCGKSHVLETLVELGAEGIDADKVAHEVMAPGGAAYEPLVAAFGGEILRPDGVVDRSKLGALVFSNRVALATLEGIVHPAVIEATRERIAATTAPAVAIEAIKLIESGMHAKLCDETWVVVCRKADQLERLARTRGMTPADVERRLVHQMPEARMIQAADRVIHADGTLVETEVLVLRAWLALGLPLPAAEVVVSAPDRVRLLVRPEAAGPRAFYERLGFGECDPMQANAPDRTQDQTTMELSL